MLTLTSQSPQTVRDLSSRFGDLDLYLAEFCFWREFREPEAAFEALLRGLVSPR